MRQTFLKSILIIVLAMAGIGNAYAIDIVTLLDGKVYQGQIIRKDDDGSILLMLADGVKRYFMIDEIASLEESPDNFTLSSEKNKKNQCASIYVSYERLFPSEITASNNKLKLLKNSNGVSLGFSYHLPIIHNLFFYPGVEIAVDWEKSDNDAINDILDKNDGLYIPGLIEAQKYDDYYSIYMPEKGWFNIRIPLLIGYRFNLNNTSNLVIQTGPVAECTILNLDFDNIDCSDTELYSYSRFNLDWRFGLKYNFKQFFVGINYNLGITNRMGANYSNDYYGYDEKLYKLRLRQNSLQIQLGMNFSL